MNVSSLIPVLYYTWSNIALFIVMICMATTDSTSMLIRLNSSKQAQAPELYSGYRIKSAKIKSL